MDGGVLNPENGYIFNPHGTSREDNVFLSMINSHEQEFTSDDGANQFNQDNVESASYADFDDNRLSLSFGSYPNAASRSLTSSCSDIMEAYQIADWNDHLSSLNTSDDEYEVLNVPDNFLFDTVGSGNPRMRSFSTSSLTGPCIPPDLIMESRDSEDFLSDSFHDLENVQEQIYLEDIHQNVQTDDMLVPLDDTMDGATLQKELIDKLTGNSSPPALAFNNNVGDTDGRLSSSHPKNEEVKMVNATPGSENVSIDGVDVSLPAGSIVLAVVNESGSLVPYSVNSQEFNGTPLTSGPEANFCLTPKSSSCAERSESNFVSSPSELMNPLSQTFNVEDRSSHLLNVNDAYDLKRNEGSLKRKLNFEVNNEKPEETVDVETICQTTPVLEASDLATLLYEFEATESVNRCIDQERNEAQDVKIEQDNIVTSYNTTETQALHPILAKALEKVTHDTSNRSQSSITITSTRPSYGGSSSTTTTTTSISIKVKKVDNSKPAKSLIERKDDLMKKKLVAHQRIKDALPREIIEKIRASGARKTTKILTEAFIPRFMGRKKKFKLPKKKPAKGITKNQKAKIQPQEKELSATFDYSAFRDHDYCINSKRTFYIKKEVVIEPEVYNKLPDYCNPIRPIHHVKEENDISECVFVENNVIANTVKIEKQESKPETKYIETPTELHNRLPDYVTDIANIKPKDESLAHNIQNQMDLEIIPNVESLTEKPKRKLNLSEYRMRIRSTENSRSSSPAISDKKTVKRFKSMSTDNSNFIDPNTQTTPSTKNLVAPTNNLITPSTNNLVNGVSTNSNLVIPTSTPLGVVAIETPMASDGVVPSSITRFGVVCIDDDCQVIQEKQNINLPRNVKRNQCKNNQEIQKMPIQIKRVPIPNSSLIVPAHQVNSTKHQLNSNVHNSSNAKTVKVIDLEEGELDDHEEENKEAGNKLALLSLLPLSKMPTTSLGHSLLYTQKMKAVQAIEERNTQKMQKVPSSSVSTSSITSSSSSISPHIYGRSRRRGTRNVCRSSSRSSRSNSSRKKSSRRSRSPRENSRLSSHRKSLRRWTRSHSRSSRRKSRSYSSSSMLSSDSSRSTSKSYSSRSRSRSRSSRRKISRSRRHRRSSRSRDRYHSRSRSRSHSRSHSRSRSRARSRSRCYEDSKRSSRIYYKRSDRSYNSSTQQHMSTRYMSKHRSMVDVERDVEERKIIYCGCIDEGTTRTELRSRFEKFGPIIDSNIHFRENGDNYGFVTFMYTESAFQALEHGNDDPKLPKYNLCFGGRRKFCTEQYSDLDAQKDEFDYYNSSDAMDYDTLLQTALNRRR